MKLSSLDQTGSTKQLLMERYRCVDDVADFVAARDQYHAPGYFRLGQATICYGQCSSAAPARLVTDQLYDALQHVFTDGSIVQLPFDPLRVVENLRYERYVSKSAANGGLLVPQNFARNLYYMIRPVMPVAVRKHFQRAHLRGWDTIPFPTWPVDRTVEAIFEQLLVLSMKSRKITRLPFVWFWPDGAPSCTILTHDVETSVGIDFCTRLMDLDEAFEIKSAFQLVPEKRYRIPLPLLESMRRRGFEINIHDLNHDGHLFSDQEEFVRRAERINCYARELGALGFRSGVMYRNIDWYGALNLSYDMSVPNVAHLDPQRGGCCTVLPFFVGQILELPLTTSQDYSLFHIMKKYSTQLWREQISLIRQKYGLISFNIHPDYIISEMERRVYEELLQYISELRSQGETWFALPREVASWWRLRSKLMLVQMGGGWRIQGEGNERARLAHAVLDNGNLTYEVEPTS